MPTADDFRKELQRRFARAAGKTAVEIVSGDVHRTLGGYPGRNHLMPLCCEVMRAEMRGADEVLAEPPRGQGASLRIRYCLPRVSWD